jgi:hypothetical protein
METLTMTTVMTKAVEEEAVEEEAVEEEADGATTTDTKSAMDTKAVSSAPRPNFSTETQPTQIAS